MIDRPYKTWAVFVLFDRERGDNKDGWHNVSGTVGCSDTPEEVISDVLRRLDLGQRWAFALEIKGKPIYDLHKPDEPRSAPSWGVYEQVVASASERRR